MADTENKSMLCVGGPRDGTRISAKSGNGFSVPVRAPIPLPSDLDARPNATGTYVVVNYRREVFNTPQGEVSFWVPEKQTPLETMKRLLEAYESHSRHTPGRRMPDPTDRERG